MICFIVSMHNHLLSYMVLFITIYFHIYLLILIYIYQNYNLENVYVLFLILQNRIRNKRKMISHSEYCRQLNSAYNEGSVQANPYCQQIVYDSSSHTILMKTGIPSKASNSMRLDHLEFKITYSHVYQEPLLLLRIWIREHNDEFTMSKLWFPKDVKQILNIDSAFQLGLDSISSDMRQHQEAWYSFHPCDTSYMIGDKPEYLDKYLERWLSVFLFSVLL
ncbi:hypothetical protein HG535_0H03790 [Zygotorulaspora mrakii]|uniref:Uncharacterized protein n=1 Tax=Zygotorulaspora mrakii TaxID=42260 RepID=A0A7H9BBC0_ZYGMR|nr:uncharacterized protein HG535_0H03790 [Zygotorulaspora mrakii]QLG75052.1 hypothetical protein HG535_0H03790 [Zygotorulaspora mrakii]